MSLSDDLKTASVQSKLGKIAELLERSQIKPEEIGKIEKIKISEWQGLTKNETGEAETHDLRGASLVISPSWTSGPEWPVVKQGPPIKLPPIKVAKEVAGLNKAIVLPDMQCGYYRDSAGNLVAIHDEKAIDLVVAFIKEQQPNLIAMNGDNADFAEFGKYRLTPAYQMTTQATIDYLTTLCARLRAAAPSAKIVWLEGNHEARLGNYILDNAMSAFGLRKGNAPESWPVMSLPYLCRFDEFKVEYLPGYPASTYWINNKLRLIHGHKVASGGSTAHKYLATEKTSVLYGHIHRREWAERTRQDWDGDKTILAASAGCLARTDGAVPSTKGGVDCDGRPIPSPEDWQQGIAVVHYEKGDGKFFLELVPILNGTMFYHGKNYRAQDKK